MRDSKVLLLSSPLPFRKDQPQVNKQTVISMWQEQRARLFGPMAVFVSRRRLSEWFIVNFSFCYRTLKAAVVSDVLTRPTVKRDQFFCFWSDEQRSWVEKEKIKERDQNETVQNKEVLWSVEERLRSRGAYGVLAGLFLVGCSHWVTRRKRRAPSFPPRFSFSFFFFCFILRSAWVQKVCRKLKQQRQELDSEDSASFFIRLIDLVTGPIIFSRC